MGVGAVFISTLAIHRLNEPTDPPITQEDYLALTLQPIIAFVVLASIIIRASKFLLVASLVTNFFTDGLSIPFFSFGRNVSRNVSLSHTLTNPSWSYPEWLVGINRNPSVPGPPVSPLETAVSQDTPGLVGQQDVVSETSQIGTHMPAVSAAPWDTNISISQAEIAEIPEPKQPKAVHFPSP